MGPDYLGTSNTPESNTSDSRSSDLAVVIAHMKSFLHHRTQDTATAQDILSKVLEGFHESRKRRPLLGPEEERKVLWGILRHKLADHYRQSANQQQRLSSLDEFEDYSDPLLLLRPTEDSVIRKEARKEAFQAIKKALSKLSPLDRYIFALGRLHYRDEEIAERCKKHYGICISPKTVTNRRSKANQMLKELLRV